MSRIVIGIIILIGILYNRLIRLRLPRELYNDLLLIEVILFSTIIIGFIISLVYSIYKTYTLYYNIEPKVVSNKCLLYIQEHPWNPINIWTKSLISLDRVIKNKSPMYDDLLSYSDLLIISIIKKFNVYPGISKFILLILRIIPQAIVCLTFCYDVLITHYFYYFYKSVWLLILPMIVTYVIYTVNDHTKGNLKNLNSFIHLFLLKEEYFEAGNIDLKKSTLISAEAWAEMQAYENSNNMYRCIYTLAKDKCTNDAAYDNLIYTQCLIYLRIFMDSYIYLQQYNIYKDFIETPFNIMKFALYLIAWTYILLYGLGIL